eukprot:1159999-Pelagomonas_calceolata.AAC.8
MLPCSSKGPRPSWSENKTSGKSKKSLSPGSVSARCEAYDYGVDPYAGGRMHGTAQHGQPRPLQLRCLDTSTAHALLACKRRRSGVAMRSASSTACASSMSGSSRLRKGPAKGCQRQRIRAKMHHQMVRTALLQKSRCVRMTLAHEVSVCNNQGAEMQQQVVCTALPWKSRCVRLTLAPEASV